MDGEELRRRRRALAMTQTELAERLGLTQNTVSRWEKGAAVIGHPPMLDLALRALEFDAAIRKVGRELSGDDDDE